MTPARRHSNQSIYQITAFCLTALSLFLLPEFAFAGPIEDGVDWLVDLLTNGIARGAAIIGIAILGYMAWAGRLSMMQAVQFIFGVILVFGGAAIVDIISEAVGS